MKGIGESSMQAIKRSYVNRVRFPKYLLKDLLGCSSVLDLGCGRGTLLKMYRPRQSTSYTGLDIFKPYLLEARRLNPEISCDWVQADISRVPIVDHSFDAVVAIEVLEHIEKNLALELVQEMERTASQKVLIIVPNGPVHQSVYDGNRFQIHRSGWSCNDLESLRYRVKGIYGLWQLRGERGITKYRPHILWELISDFSQVMINGHPEYASHLYAVKKL